MTVRAYRDIAKTGLSFLMGLSMDGSSGGAFLEVNNGVFVNGIFFRFTKPYDRILGVTVSSTKPNVEANVYYEEIKNGEGKFKGVKVYSIIPLSDVKISLMAVVY